MLIRHSHVSISVIIYNFKYLLSLFNTHPIEISSTTEAQKRYKKRSVYFIVGIIFKRVSHKTKRLANYCPNGDRECITFNYCQTKHLQHGIFVEMRLEFTLVIFSITTVHVNLKPLANTNTIIACLTLFESHAR